MISICTCSSGYFTLELVPKLLGAWNGWSGANQLVLKVAESCGGTSFELLGAWDRGKCKKEEKEQ